MKRPRNLYIHCGLHKTATSSLQFVLSTRGGALQEAGVLYPKAGRLSQISGHHNIAWQLVGDHRFREEYGDLNAAFNEIDRFDGDAVLSSEDFEGVLACPEKWQAVLQMARRGGWNTTLVIYLRNQAHYLESLYQELLKHRYNRDFGYFAQEVLETGTLRFEAWRFHFDYSALLHSMSSIDETKMVVFNYHESSKESVIADFFELLKIPYQKNDSKIYQNARDDLNRSLVSFYRNRIPRPLRECEISAVDRVCLHISDRALIGNHLRDLVKGRFLTSNFEVCKKYKLSRAGLTDFSLPATPVNSACFEKIFSAETCVALSRMAEIIEGAVQEENLDFAPKLREIAEPWSSWVHMQVPVARTTRSTALCALLRRLMPNTHSSRSPFVHNRGDE